LSPRPATPRSAPGDAPRGRPPRPPGRGLARRLATLLVAGSLLFAAAWGWLLPALLRPRIEAAIAAVVGGPVSIGSLSVGPRADLFLRDLRLGAGGRGPRIERLDIDPDLRRVLRGEIVLNRVAARGVEAGIESGTYGDRVIDGLPSGDEWSLPNGFDVREFLIRDARIALRTSVGDGQQDVEIDRLVARQVPTPATGSRILARAEGRFEGVPLTGEAAIESAGGERRVAVSLAAEPIRFIAGTPEIEPSDRRRLEGIRALLAARPDLGAIVRPRAIASAPAAHLSDADPLARRRIDAVRAALDVPRVARPDGAEGRPEAPLRRSEAGAASVPAVDIELRSIP